MTDIRAAIGRGRLAESCQIKSVSGGVSEGLLLPVGAWGAALDVIEASAKTLERQTDIHARWAMSEIEEKLAAFAAAMGQNP